MTITWVCKGNTLKSVFSPSSSNLGWHCLWCRLHAPPSLRLRNGLSAWYVVGPSGFTVYPDVPWTVPEAGKGIVFLRVWAQLQCIAKCWLLALTAPKPFITANDTDCEQWICLPHWNEEPSGLLGPRPSLQRPGIPPLPGPQTTCICFKLSAVLEPLR